MAVKTAVVGVGLHGQNHALVYDDYPSADLVLVCDANLERAKEIAHQYQCEATDRLDDILDSEIEAVSVATPDHLHFDVTRRLLEKKKHVLLEKPMTTDVGEAEALQQAADAAGVNLMINFSQRWNPKHIAVKERIEAGELGDILYGFVRLTNTLGVPRAMLSWSGMSGPEWFLFPHTMDVTTWLIGQQPISVYATGIKRVNKAEGRDVFDAIHAQVRYEDSFITYETAWVLPESSPTVAESKYELFGSKGFTTSSGNDGVDGVFGDSGLRHLGTVPLARRNYYGKVSGFYFESIRHFVDAIGAEEPTRVSARDGLLNTRMIAATLRSIESGQVEQI